MAKIDIRPKVEAQITITLSEEEAAALDAITGYGIDAFLGIFYKHMGRTYLQPYEKGLRSLFDSVSKGDANVSQFLSQVKIARKVFEGVPQAASDLQTKPFKLS
jgi:hypothetical protein